MIGLDHQGHGYATAAATQLVRWLSEHGVERVVGHIRPDHAASAAVARRLGLRSVGDELYDGERRWTRELQAPDPAGA